MSSVVTVLYEDEAAAKPTNYGPHILLLACVADARGTDVWILRGRTAGIPKKGDTKVRAALRDEGDLLATRGPLVAMVDDDRVRRCYGLPTSACKREVLDAVLREATGSPSVVLLHRNMEDIVGAACAALHRAAPAAKPGPEERDRILHRAAAAERNVRDAILAAVPSFARLVKTVDRLLTTVDHERLRG
jgi:hypothetical protein